MFRCSLSSSTAVTTVKRRVFNPALLTGHSHYSTSVSPFSLRGWSNSRRRFGTIQPKKKRQRKEPQTVAKDQAKLLEVWEQEQSNKPLKKIRKSIEKFGRPLAKFEGYTMLFIVGTTALCSLVEYVWTGRITWFVSFDQWASQKASFSRARHRIGRDSDYVDLEVK